MTRLVEKDIDTVSENMKQLDDEFKKICGVGIKEIAAYAIGIDSKNAAPKKIGVVPITSGLGIIGGFSDAVFGILKYLGADAFITKGTDVNGFYESAQVGECTIMADDDRYISINHKSGKISDNGYATGIGFAAALCLAIGDIKSKKTLVAGAGPVGLAAAKFLSDHGADILVYEIDKEKLKNLPYKTTDTIENMSFDCILEATTSSDVIGTQNLNSNTIAAAPGMPLGLSDDAAKVLKNSNRLIHNPLELGTAVMYMEVL